MNKCPPKSYRDRRAVSRNLDQDNVNVSNSMTSAKHSAKFEDLPHKHHPPRSIQTENQKPLKKLLRQISESEPIVMRESLATRYTRILGVVALYW